MLERTNWNQTEAAERFQIPLSTLNQKIKRLGIETRRRTNVAFAALPRATAKILPNFSPASRSGTEIAVQPLEPQESAASRNILEDAVRRCFRRHQRSGRNQKCLFEGVLPGHHRVRHAIGKHDPGGQRRKFQCDLRAIFLKLRVFLQNNRGIAA